MQVDERVAVEQRVRAQFGGCVGADRVGECGLQFQLDARQIALAFDRPHRADVRSAEPDVAVEVDDRRGVAELGPDDVILLERIRLRRKAPTEEQEAHGHARNSDRGVARYGHGLSECSWRNWPGAGSFAPIPFAQVSTNSEGATEAPGALPTFGR